LIFFAAFLICSFASLARVNCTDHTVVVNPAKEKVKYKVEVVPYDSNWPKMYEKEATLLKQRLGDNAVAIHHVGSTSVPGLHAKPIIDIIAVVKEAPSTIKALESIRYEYKGEYNIPFHFNFSKKGNPKVYVHLFEEGNPEIELNLLFRDYLRSHPESVKEYANLKAYLLTQESSFEKTNSKFKGYTLGKDSFIRKILKNAGFNRLRIMHCTHQEELKMANVFRQKYFQELKMPDPDIQTFNHPEHIHLCLYQGINIIGYAHLQLLTKEEAILRIFVMDETFRNQNYESEFLTLFEKWLRSKNYKSLQVITSQTLRDFYEKYGFKEVSQQNNGLNKRKVDRSEIKMLKMLKVVGMRKS